MSVERRIVRIEWKDEDEIEGVAVGPVYEVYSDGTRTDLGWQAKGNAMYLAEYHKVEFIES